MRAAQSFRVSEGLGPVEITGRYRMAMLVARVQRPQHLGPVHLATCTMPYIRPRSRSRLGASLLISELTAEQAAKSLGWSGSRVSRIETGKQLMSPEDARKLVGLYYVG